MSVKKTKKLHGNREPAGGTRVKVRESPNSSCGNLDNPSDTGCFSLDHSGG